MHLIGENFKSNNFTRRSTDFKNVKITKLAEWNNFLFGYEIKHKLFI